MKLAIVMLILSAISIISCFVQLTPAVLGGLPVSVGLVVAFFGIIRLLGRLESKSSASVKHQTI